MERVGEILKESATVEALTSEEGPETCPHCGAQVRYREAAIGARMFRVRLACPCQIKAHEERMRDLVFANKQAEIDRLFPAEKGNRIEACTFQNWIPRQGAQVCFEVAFRYARDFDKHLSDGTGLLFYGRPGNGKTHLAGAIYNDVKNQGRTCLARSLLTVFRRYQESYDPNPPIREADVSHALRDCDLLVLDDLGADQIVTLDGNKRTMTPWGETKLYEIVDTRYSYRKPTIFTTNCTLPELRERVGARTYSRLEEMCPTFYENRATDFRHERALIR